MFILTGFGDEISPDLEEQMDVMEKEGINLIEFREVSNMNVLDITDEQAKKEENHLK
jgi:hypothetical protein